MSGRATIEDVRRALWKAYVDLVREDVDGEWKSSEAWCEVSYPNFWECLDDDEADGGVPPSRFQEPTSLMVYSYALGPSRHHYFHRADTETHPNYYTWTAPDIFAKAVEVIDGWASARRGEGIVTP